MQALFLLLAILAGAAVPIQFAVNSELRGAVGGTITAAAISFLVGTLVLGRRCFWPARVFQLSLTSPARRGGPGSGVARRLLHCRFDNPDPQAQGAANTVAFVLAGQVLASMIHSIYLARLGGGALVIAGVFVVLRT